MPSRALIGLRAEFQRWTRGNGIMTQRFLNYEPLRGQLGRTRKGVLISMAEGVATGFALNLLQERGILFVTPGQRVYSGMIIGENSRDEDMEVNPCKEKHLSNVRNKGSEEQVKLSPPRIMTLEEAMGYIQADELVEITPKTVRLRKAELDSNLRKVHTRRASKQQ